jgi:hypothetical protein
MNDSKYFEPDYHDGDCECQSCNRRRSEEAGLGREEQAQMLADAKDGK